MHLQVLLTFTLLLLWGDLGPVTGQLDNDCDPIDVDPIELVNIGAFATESIAKETGVTLEDVVKMLAVDPKSQADLDGMITANENLRIASEGGSLSVEYTETEKADLDLKTIYIPKCPVRYYWIPRFIYGFRSSLVSDSSSRKYCWAYYPILAATCRQRYCSLTWNVPIHMRFFWPYRCFPYYRLIWIRARCLTISGSSFNWTSEYILRWIPKGCDCKKMGLTSVAIAQNTCPRMPS